MNSKLLLIFILLTGCRQCPEKAPPYTVQEFTGREEGVDSMLVRRPVYRAKVPVSWVRQDPEGSIRDTRKPNVSFFIEDDLLVTVHTFPTECLEERIPPAAQVERWKSRAGDADTRVLPACHGGFAGFCLEGQTVLAWSMQLDLEHYQTLGFLAACPLEEEHFKQMRADYTIKAVGPKELIERHRDELQLFADSFELIQEIPKRT